MISCTRRIQFCSGHRVYKHEGKCRNMHGHNYLAFITAEADDLDNVGRIIDFSVLKEKIGGWIDDNWDHGFLYFKDDSETKAALECINQQKQYEMCYNPTAENMAKFLLEVVCPLMLKDTGVVVTKIRIWETENCYADAELEDSIK